MDTFQIVHGHYNFRVWDVKKKRNEKKRKDINYFYTFLHIIYFATMSIKFMIGWTLMFRHLGCFISCWFIKCWVVLFQLQKVYRLFLWVLGTRLGYAYDVPVIDFERQLRFVPLESRYWLHYASGLKRRTGHMAPQSLDITLYFFP